MLQCIGELPCKRHHIANLLLALTLSASFFVMAKRYAHNAEEAMAQKGAVFTAVADETRNQQARLLADGSVDIDALKAELEEAIKKGGKYDQTRFFANIPIIAGRNAASAQCVVYGVALTIPPSS